MPGQAPVPDIFAAALLMSKSRASKAATSPAKPRQPAASPRPERRSEPRPSSKDAVSSAAPFAHLRSAGPFTIKPSSAERAKAPPAASTADLIVAAGKVRRGEAPLPPMARTEATESRRAVATAQLIIEAGKRRRGEIA